MRLSDEFLSELRYRNPIEDVISSYVELKNSGSTLKGLCPFHNEKTPSFTVYPATSSYYCFGCQNGGDVITFLRQIENLDYIETVKLLCDRSGMTMPQDGYDDSQERTRKRILEINRLTARFYHDCLMDKNIGAKGFTYFAKRGIDVKTMNHFGLGYAPDTGFALCNHLRNKGYSESELILANVASRSKKGNIYDRFRGKTMFPLIDLRGNVIAFGGRKFPGEEGGKYINTSDTPVYKKSRNLFALNFAKNAKTDTLILCEGYMDVIAMHQFGITNAVAALGTAFTEEMASLIARYAKEVIVTMDSDAPGQKGARRAINILNKTGLKVKVLIVPAGKDPDEYIRAYGVGQFRKLLENAESDIEFKLNTARDKYDVDSDDGRVSYIGEAVEILAATNNEIAQNLYAGRLADKYGISKNVILSQIAKQKKIQTRQREKKQFHEIIEPKISHDEVNPEARQHKRAAAAEEYILSIMMNDPALCDKARELLKSDDFVTDFSKRVFTAVSEIAESGREFEIVLLGDDFLPQELGKISQIYNTVIQGDESVLLSCIDTLKAEKNKISQIDTSQMSNDDFAKLMNDIGKNKK